MKPVKPLTPPALKTAGTIPCKYAGGAIVSGFSGARRIALPLSGTGGKKAISQSIKNITSSLHFYNQIAVKISIKASYPAHSADTALQGRSPDVSLFARSMIDAALKRELDSQIAVMARGENVAANQRRRHMLEKYLLTKPYRVVKGFYSASMQKLAPAGQPAGAEREESGFHSDIIHERVSKTVYAPVKTQIERVADSGEAAVSSITDTELNRIAERAAQKVERKMRSERERNGKWQ